MRYFKVKFGYKGMDYESIEEKDLEKAIYAQITGNAVHLGKSFINGKNIIAITPHYHRHTGWYESYEPTDGEDWAQIKRDCPPYEGILENYKNRVNYLIKSGKTELIGKNSEIPQLEQNRVTFTTEISEGAKLLADQFKF